MVRVDGVEYPGFVGDCSISRGLDPETYEPVPVGDLSEPGLIVVAGIDNVADQLPSHPMPGHPRSPTAWNPDYAPLEGPGCSWSFMRASAAEGILEALGQSRAFVARDTRAAKPHRPVPRMKTDVQVARTGRYFGCHMALWTGALAAAGSAHLHEICCDLAIDEAATRILAGAAAGGDVSDATPSRNGPERPGLLPGTSTRTDPPADVIDDAVSVVRPGRSHGGPAGVGQVVDAS